MSDQAKLPRGVAAAIAEAARLRYAAAQGKSLRVSHEHLIDLDDYAHTLTAERDSEKARADGLEKRLAEVTEAADNLLTRKLGINEERIVLKVRESDYDCLAAAIRASKGEA